VTFRSLTIAMEGKTTAYVCKRGICKLPTSDPAEFEKQIGEVEMLKGAH